MLYAMVCYAMQRATLLPNLRYVTLCYVTYKCVMLMLFYTLHYI